MKIDTRGKKEIKERVIGKQATESGGNQRKGKFRGRKKRTFSWDLRPW